MRFLILFTGASALLCANPENGTVVAGQAAIAEKGNLLEISTSDRAVIHWDSFSIGANETTRFIQPSTASAVLNRVVTNEMSHLQGLLQSNGQVYLVNPNGVVVGKEGRIDAAAFVACSLDIRTEDFIQGTEFQIQGDGLGEIINLGSIETQGGPVALLGHRVENSGSIEAASSLVSLGAGHEILLRPSGQTLLFIRPDLKAAGVANQGSIKALEAQIQADGGISLAINLGGSVEAVSIVSKEGKIFLQAAEGDIHIQPSASLVAEEIVVEGRGRLIQEGNLNVSGDVGGKVHLFSQDIALRGGTIDASGENGGGEVLIGGSGKLKIPDLFTAKHTYVSSDAEIKADALQNGNGGRVVVWADDEVEFHGKMSGAALGLTGDGGFGEVSGHSFIFSGHPDFSSENGKPGTFVLDPGPVQVVHEATCTMMGPNTISDACINATLDSGGSSGMNVLVESTDANIDVDGNVVISWTKPSTLTLLAAENVTFGMAVPAPGAQITNTATGTSFDAIVIQNTAMVSGQYNGIDVPFTTLLNLQTDSGNIVMTGIGGDVNTAGAACNGIYTNALTAHTTSGNITLTGTGGGDGMGQQNVGVYLHYRDSISTVSGQITITGTSATTTGSTAMVPNAGVYLFNRTTIAATGPSHPTVTVTGTNPGFPTSNTYGVIMQQSTGSITTSGTGGMNITGSGGDANNAPGSTNLTGVYIQGALTANGTSPITVTGTSGINSESNNVGFQTNGATIAADAGTVTLHGTASGSGNDNYGVFFDNVTEISIGTSAVEIMGISNANGMTGADNIGIYVSGSNNNMIMDLGSLEAAGTGGTAGGVGNHGIFLENSSWTCTGSGASPPSWTITGIARGTASTGDGNHGFVLVNGGVRNYGPLSVIGQANASANNGIEILSGSFASLNAVVGPLTLSTTGGSNALITGTGGSFTQIFVEDGNVIFEIDGDLTVNAAGLSGVTEAIGVTGGANGSVDISVAGDIVFIPSPEGFPVVQTSSTTGPISIEAGGSLSLTDTLLIAGTSDIHLSAATHEVDGTVSLYTSAGTITLTGTVNVNADAVIQTTDGSTYPGRPIVFDSDIVSIGGPNALVINSGTGSMRFNGDVGTSGNPLGSIALISSDTTGAIFPGVTLNSTGRLTSNANITLTSGPVALNAANLVFNRPIFGAQNLTLNATSTMGIGSGSITFPSGIGTSGTPIGALTVINNDISAFGNILNGTTIYASSVDFVSTSSAAPRGNGQVIFLGSPSVINTTNGPVTFGGYITGGLNVTVNAGSGAVTFSGIVNGLASDFSINGGPITVNQSWTGSGSVAFNALGNINLATNVSMAVTGSSTIQLQSPSNAIALGNNVTVQAADGDILFLAGTNITAAGPGTIQTTGTASTVTLVVDNLFPTPPGIGNGMFTFPSSMTLCSDSCGGGTGKVLLYAAQPGTGTFPSTINGIVYTPGTFSGSTYIPGTNEFVGYWYNVPPFPPDPPFEVIFKGFLSPPPPPPSPTPSPATQQTIQLSVVEPVANPAQIAVQSIGSSMQAAATPDPANTCGIPSVSIRVN